MMKKMLFCLLCLFLLSCNRKEWKYKIIGKLKVDSHLRNDHSHKIPNWGIWYTDTFYVKNDTIRIPNSDGTEYTIPADSSQILVSK